MKVYKKVLSRDTGNWLLCCWADCEKQGYDLYAIRVRDGVDGNGNPKYIKYVFCSEKHKLFHAHSHVRYGGVPDGYRGVL